MWSCHEALAFGRQPVRLTVLRLGWNPRATAPGFMDRLFRHLEQPDAESDPLPSRPLPIQRDEQLEQVDATPTERSTDGRLCQRFDAGLRSVRLGSFLYCSSNSLK